MFTRVPPTRTPATPRAARKLEPASSNIAAGERGPSGAPPASFEAVTRPTFDFARIPIVPPMFQRKALVSSPGDSREREADEVAERVTQAADAGPAPSIRAAGPTMTNAPVLHRKAGAQGAQAAVSDVVPAGPGRPLDPRTRSEFEDRFARDFSGVRVHTDARASASARAVEAIAYTIGQDIVFREGAYAPETGSGRRLLAHELTHVVQQSGHPRQPIIQKKADDLASPSESAAEPEDPELALGQKLLTDYPLGITVMFYEIDDPVFKGEATRWAVDNGAIGITGKEFKADAVQVGVAMPEHLDVPAEKPQKGTQTLEIPQMVEQLGQVLKSAVEAASAASGTDMNANAYKIKTLALASHGWEGGTSLGITNESYSDFFTGVSPYLTSDVNVVYYACTVAISATGGETDEEHDQWLKVFTDPGGQESLTGKTRDKLAELGHPEATVWGHTAVGHFMNNYTLRVFDAATPGQPGQSFMKDTFQPIIDAIETDVTTALRAMGYAVTSDTDVAAVKTAVYEEIKQPLRRCYAKAMSDQRMEIMVNGKAQQRKLAEMAPVHPDEVATIIRSYYENTWPGTKPDPQAVAGKVAVKLKGLERR